MQKEIDLLHLQIEALEAENIRLRKSESDRGHALNLLAESERRVSTLMANLPGMAYRCLNDEFWTMEFVSDGCLELTGFPPDHLLENRRTSYAEIIHPEDRKMVREQAEISLDKRSQFNLTYRIITAGGQEKWVIEKGQGVFSDSGGLLAIEGFITEITERRRAEEAQRQSEEKFRLAFQTSPDAINLNRLSDGMYIDINEGFTKLTGFTREDVSGKTSLELSVWDDPKDREHLVKHLMAEGFVRNFEARFRGKSGQIKTALMSARVLELDKEKVILSITRDITDYKRTEETLRASQALIEGIINAIPVRVFWKDMNLVYLGCNEAFARDAGFAEPKEIVGKDDYQMGWRDRADQYRGDDRDVIDSGCSKFLIEEPLTTPEGNTVTLLTNKIPLRNAKGEITGVLGTYIDISERKRTEEALKQSEHSAMRFAQEKEVLAEIGRIISSNLNIEEVYERFAAEVRKIISFDRIAINLVNIENKTIVVQYVSGLAIDGRAAGDEFPLLGTTTAMVVESGRGMMIPALMEEEIASRLPGHLPLRRAGMKSMLLAPLISKGEAFGALVLLSAEPNKYNAEDISIAENVAAQIGGAIANALLLLECKRAEEGLRRSEDRYRDLVEHSHDLICTHDLEGRLLSANPKVSAALGYEPDLLLQMNLRDGLVPEERGKFENYLQEIRTHGQAKGLMCVQTKTGERRIWEYNNTLRTEGVAEPIVRGMAHDITERKLAEDALRESQVRLHTIIQTEPECVKVVASDGTLMEMNAAGLRMIEADSAQACVGKSVYQIVAPSHRSAFQALTEKVCAGEDGALEFEIIGLKGSHRWADTHATPLRDAHGNILGALGITRDITERKKAEQEREKLQAQIRQSQKMEAVGRLSGGVAHDFNNMLGVIIGFTELAAMKLSPNDPVHLYLEEVKTAAQRSADITRQLLAFARKQIISPKLLDINDTIASMLNMLRRLIGENIDLLWKPAKDIFPVKMDPAQIDQVLANLVVNARDAIEGVGKITIETGKAEFDTHYCETHVGTVPGRYVLLAVSDDGCGMDKKTLATLFEPFFTTKEVGKGTGLGLATVYGIVKQNNGFIDVYSEPGKGTTFKIYLPRQEQQAAATEQPRQPVEVPTGTETVLLVEDERPLLKFAGLLLEQLGYTVLACGSPREAVRKAKEYANEIHLLMTDVIMPGMSGRELCVELEADRPGLKCLFMSGYTADVIAHQGVLDEGVYFLQKPFSREALAKKVRETLS